MRKITFLEIAACSAMAALGAPGALAINGNGLDASAILDACAAKAADTPATLRDGGTVMWCAVLDREGVLLAIEATDTRESACPPRAYASDAIRISIEISIAKAWTAVSASSNALALDSKAVGLAARPDGPGNGGNNIGTNRGKGSLFGVGDTNPYQRFIENGTEKLCGEKHRGIVTFAGGQPIYHCETGQLIGGVGVSGDGVDQDDIVAKGAVTDAGYCLTP